MQTRQYYLEPVPGSPIYNKVPALYRVGDDEDSIDVPARGLCELRRVLQRGDRQGDLCYLYPPFEVDFEFDGGDLYINLYNRDLNQETRTVVISSDELPEFKKTLGELVDKIYDCGLVCKSKAQEMIEMPTEPKPVVIGVSQLYKLIDQPTFWLWKFTQPENTGDTTLYAFLPAEAVLADNLDKVDILTSAEAVLNTIRKTEGLYYHGGDPRQELDDYITHKPNR